MNYILFKTIDRKARYLSATGRWVKSKVLARVFASYEEAKAEADKQAAGITTYTFRAF